MKNYEKLALLFAEKHGIFAYWNFDNKMVWEEYFINEGRFLHILNLDTNEEEVIKTEKAEWEK